MIVCSYAEFYRPEEELQHSLPASPENSYHRDSVQGPDDKGGLFMDDVEPIPITSGANLGRTCSNLRPPAVVTEFMSQGSVKSALARKSEVVVGNMHRVVVAMDAAKVRYAYKLRYNSAGQYRK